eukprot:gb/GECG01012404.1/.p1 GENE.gb/GECG01012404.1/~~gb/GECG01012404.1/.p1  ORF type:complete len:943 (+),score=119.35 gb/GECG01012404.1/:1-2829(+)
MLSARSSFLRRSGAGMGRFSSARDVNLGGNKLRGNRKHGPAPSLFSRNSSNASTGGGKPDRGGIKRKKALSQVRLGVPKEIWESERRVSQSPASIQQLKKKGFDNIFVESGAGVAANFSDKDYEAAGATIVPSQADLYETSNFILKVRPPTMAGNQHEVDFLQKQSDLISFLYPARDEDLVNRLMQQEATAFAMDCIPRISRAQVFDALSSMANISGYKAVVEAASHFDRFFAGQMTAAGRVPPAKVLVIGGGVAGLSSMATAKNLGAIVRGFDTRPAVKEQVESLGAEFLEVDTTGIEEESGEGSGGYAKEMSDEFIRREMELFSKQASEVDVIITTALIPGKPAPKLITKDMVSRMKTGSIIVDLASENGGNCELTEPGKLAESNGVKIVGYTDFPSRLPTQSSTLYANNVSKLLMSMTNKEGEYIVDLNDDVVRGSIVTLEGEKMWPPPAIADPSPPKQQKDEKGSLGQPEDISAAEKLYRTTRFRAFATGGALSSMIGIGLVSPTPEFSTMVTTLGLAGVIGYNVVWGVQPSLHSPLMSVTNAVSGMTAVGGMALMGGGVIPHTTGQALAAAAAGFSAVNIGGGFLVTHRMLDMFRRPEDPPEPMYLYGIPAAMFGGGYLAAAAMGAEQVHQLAYLGSSLCCIGAIAGLSQHSTARSGNALGMIGVGGGILATLGHMSPSASVMAQMTGVLGGGGVIGYNIAKKVAITELPELTAAFHSSVGLAAVLTGLSKHLGEYDSFVTDAVGKVNETSVYLGTWIGGVTLTGSLVAFAKLRGLLDSKPLDLSGKNMLNAGMATASVGAMGVYCSHPSAETGLAALLSATGLSGAMGAHMTASIGGADMPVVITVLNSYSGWALCAEGFMLNNDLLTIVGALVGSSGAILSYIMCEGMNRSLPNVILGGWNENAKVTKATEQLEHTEVDIQGSLSYQLDKLIATV